MRSTIFSLTCLIIIFSARTSYAQLVYPGGGSGSYATTFPSGPFIHFNPDPKLNEAIYFSQPCLDRWFKRAHPKVVSGFNKPIATNEWWSAHMWNYETDSTSLPSDTTAYGTLMYYEPGWKIAPFGMANHAHPLSFTGRAYGLDISSQNGYMISSDTKTAQYNNIMHLNIGINGMLVPNTVGTKVVDYGDWTAKIRWEDHSGNSLDVTSGHGLPYIYCTKTGGNVNIRYNGTLINWAQTANSLGITINDGSGSGGHYYGIFFPAGTVVSGINAMNTNNSPSIFITQDEAQAKPNVALAPRPAFVLQLPSGQNYFSIAVLPDTAAATLQLFRQHAFAFVTGSKVSWNYNESSATVTTSFTLTTQAMEGSETNAIQALYRHQYINSSSVNTNYTYTCPRGLMKVLTGNTFSTSMKHLGLIPNLPWVGSYDSLYMYRLFDNMMSQTSYFWENAGYNDSYGWALMLGRYADMIPLARQVGHKAAYNALIDSVRTQLENWFTAGGGKSYKMFFYDSEWNTLVPYPAGYFANAQLNDHHFHYGYFIKAAAMLARYVPGWAVKWGPMVETLIKDIDNWDRTDTKFPFLRFFDPYAGHSWASGHANFMDGNNQESATESINFATAVALWGANTNNNTLRDLGIFLATNEIQALQQYWWNKDGVSNPSGFGHTSSALIWGNKSEYRTWFVPGDPRHVHGIEWLPFTGASMFLGYDPNLVQRNYNELLVQEPILSTVPVVNTPLWTQGKDFRDLAAMYLALSDANSAIAKENLLRSQGPPTLYAGATYPYPAFFGTSLPLTHHWIHSFDSLGHVDLTSADFATTNVFIKDNCKHYVIYNPPGLPARTIHFSDGNSFDVEADTLQVFHWCPKILPVQIMDFNAVKSGQHADIIWSTVQEQNSDWFIVQRSTDGKNFIDIGKVKAAGNSKGILHYSYSDNVPNPGLNYYRLKETDLNGTNSYSTIKVLAFDNNEIVYLYPNPASSTLNLIANNIEELRIELFDLTGKLVLSTQHVSAIDISFLAAGIYIAKVYNSTYELVKKEKLQVY